MAVASPKPAEAIEQFDVGLRVKQRVVLVLAINMHQQAADFRKQIELAETAIQVNAILARAANHPPDDQFVSEIDAGALQFALDGFGKIFK